jgi:hypothetical protein
MYEKQFSLIVFHKDNQKYKEVKRMELPTLDNKDSGILMKNPYEDAVD